MDEILNLRKKIRVVKNNINYTSLIHTNKPNEKSIRWLQSMLNDFITAVIYLIQYDKHNDHEMSEIVQAIVDWYSADEHHPMKPLPKDIKDSFWGALRYVIGEEIFDEKFEGQLQQFYQPSEKVEPDVKRIQFRKPSTELVFSIDIYERVRTFTNNKSIFTIEQSSPLLATLENDTKRFLLNILDVYKSGKLSQALFNKNLKVFQAAMDSTFNKLDSEDMEDLKEFIDDFSSHIGLNNGILQ